MDKLSRIKAFVQVVETGSFSAASERLGITRAATSKYISQLEELLGGRLLNRSTRHVSTTESGKIYFAHCKDILEHLEEADDIVTGLSGKPKGTLRLTAPNVFAQRHLIPLLREFTELYPAVKVDITVNDYYVDLVGEGYDLAIRVSNLENSDLIARRLTCCQHVIVASPDYLRRAAPLHTPEDLKHHSCMLYSYTAGGKWPFSKDGADHTVKIVEPVLCSNNPGVLLEAAIQGMGVTIMPTFIASDDIVSGKLSVVLRDYESLSIGIYAVYVSRHYLPSKVRVFIDFLKSKISEEPYWDVAIKNKRG